MDRLEKLVSNTVRNANNYAQTRTEDYRISNNQQKREDLGVFHPNRNTYNVFEYQQGHPNHINKGSEIRPLVGRPFGIQDRIHSDNGMIERNLNRMVNVSGTMIRNADLPIRQNMRTSA
jgi:hypothetical protein